MSDWRPIGTAPKDGTKILLWDARYDGVCSGYWHPEFNGWRASGTEEMMHWCDMTHWRPQPPGPTQD
jgi:hypothetical protein